MNLLNKLTVQYKGYDELYFWLALSPIYEMDGMSGLFLEAFCRRIEFRWRQA